MKRRARAAGFLLLALIAAAAAAAIADGYRSSAADGYGALVPVVVAEADLRAGKPIGPEQIASTLQLRRVPRRFVPEGALVLPGEALGLTPMATVPAGSYLLSAQLRANTRARHRPLPVGPARRAVEIAVSGADALIAFGASRGQRVDIVVTTEPSGSDPGRTYVAAAGVPLLALGPGADGPGPGGLSTATLGLTRRQALRLIGAESFARQLTVMPGA